MPQPSLTFRIATVVFLVVACFGFAYLLTIPKWDSYNSTKATLVQAQNQNQQITQSLASLQGFLGQYNTEKTNNDVATMDLALPLKTSDMQDFLTNISSLAQQSGINLTSFQPSDESNSSFAPVLPTADNSIHVDTVNAVASGSYAEIKDFISRVEANLRLIDIKKVSFSTDDSGAVEAQLQFQIYYQQNNGS